MNASDQQRARIAISISESPDMLLYGLSDLHLKDAAGTLALHLLGSGVNLAYGGDLRIGGFTELLFELTKRYRRPFADSSTPVVNYLAWPVHLGMTVADLGELESELKGCADLVLLDPTGTRLSMESRAQYTSRSPEESEWSTGLTAMRRLMGDETDARILLGGRLKGYKGRIPGIAEEAIISMEKRQPLFLIGGFGGCARDIAETLGLAAEGPNSRVFWPGRAEFCRWSVEDLHNGLSREDNMDLAGTPHIDQAILLLQIGLKRVGLV